MYNELTVKVKDIFDKKFVSISPDATIYDAVKLIFGAGHSGLPVTTGKKHHLVGFITDQDITADMFPSVKDFMEDYVHAHDFEAMEKKIKPVLKKKVKDVMSKRVVSIHLEDPVLKAEAIMKVKDVRRLPVVDDDKNLLGMVSKRDIFKALVRPELRGFK